MSELNVPAYDFLNSRRFVPKQALADFDSKIASANSTLATDILKEIAMASAAVPLEDRLLLLDIVVPWIGVVSEGMKPSSKLPSVSPVAAIEIVRDLVTSSLLPPEVSAQSSLVPDRLLV